MNFTVITAFALLTFDTVCLIAFFMYVIKARQSPPLMPVLGMVIASGVFSSVAYGTVKNDIASTSLVVAFLVALVSATYALKSMYSSLRNTRFPEQTILVEGE